MQAMSNVKRGVICGLCIALCYVLPLAFHAIGSGAVFCPMHIPVFICGLVCGWPYGLLCGLAGPLLSSLLTAMPPAAMLPPMMLELAVYGLLSGLLMSVLRSKNTYVDLYASLILAMLAGRVVAGAARALIFAAGEYSLATWVSGYFLISWPGTLIQLAFIPSIVFALIKARLIPARYPNGK